MRMPLEAHKASMLVFGAVTSSSATDHKTRAVGRPSRPMLCVIPARLSKPADDDGFSHQIAPQHQRGRGAVAALAVIAGPPPHLAKTGARVKPARRRVVLIHFEKHRAGAK